MIIFCHLYLFIVLLILFYIFVYISICIYLLFLFINLFNNLCICFLFFYILISFIHSTDIMMLTWIDSAEWVPLLYITEISQIGFWRCRVATECHQRWWSRDPAAPLCHHQQCWSYYFTPQWKLCHLDGVPVTKPTKLTHGIHSNFSSPKTAVINPLLYCYSTAHLLLLHLFQI